MNIFISIMVLAGLSFLFMKENLANTEFSYLIDDEKKECIFFGGNQKILLASGEERTYFFFPCFGFEAKYEVNTSYKKYLIAEVLLAPTPRNNAIFLRSIEKIGNNFQDNTDLSYFLMSCIPLKKGGNKQLISYILNNLENYKKMCNMGNGYLTMNKNTYLHDYKNKKFLIKKSYLVKDDDILVSDYLFQDGVLWILANYKDTTKKWIFINFK
ncbi:MAG: hypothetical protein KA277_10390 [Fusobacteriaceae bacterium]|nr:hypothetical protein [Fusobacteriaceae bacterium]MBP6468405.1 hypothetical protein [Fusobacteriaceae bacterium]